LICTDCYAWGYILYIRIGVKSKNDSKKTLDGLEDRYKELVGSTIEIYSINPFDLSECLKVKYGTNYIERDRGRYSNLAKLHGFKGFKIILK
tara:strand:- start:627 stop:902 length:276 start_codon:yes stop_codon:yes gene_type:complete